MPTDYPFWRLDLAEPLATIVEGSGALIVTTIREALDRDPPCRSLSADYVSGSRAGIGGAIHSLLGLSRELVDISLWFEQTESGFTFVVVDGRGTEHALAALPATALLEVVAATVERAAVPEGFAFEITH